MPTPDFSAIARWPNVPACFGWLSLDRRGRWRLKGELIAHEGLVSFINRQYTVGGDGRCYFQNGPQRVFVALEYTPWVLRLDVDGGLAAHTGERPGAADSAWVDDEGNLLLQTRLGIGVLDDRDLSTFLSQCVGDPLADDDDSRGRWRGVVIGRIGRAEVARRFGFVADPAP